jgi:hypothetical protein
MGIPKYTIVFKAGFEFGKGFHISHSKLEKEVTSYHLAVDQFFVNQMMLAILC